MKRSDRTRQRWAKLLNNARRKDLRKDAHTTGTAAGRLESERDYDRILFAAPTRRLADKTQVYPMEVNDSVRTRLTHSHEVSNLARSIGVRLAFEHAEKVFGSQHEALNVKRVVPSVLAAVGLAHDLGNPPFGHQGEKSIQEWFQGRAAKQDIAKDFTEFDGNAQTFRLLSRLQLLNDDYGLNLTLGTLAALVKYPSVFGARSKEGYKKHGIFGSEAAIIEEVWAHTGLGRGMRHPLVYIVEACDDIAYSVIDAEDTVKKGYASFYDLMDFLESFDPGDSVIREVVRFSRGKNAEFRKENLSSRELNDISMQMFRVRAIARMVEAATETFVTHSDQLLFGNPGATFELIKESSCHSLCEAAKKFDYRYGFRNTNVLRLELVGSNYIKSMMDLMWPSISRRPKELSPFNRFVFGEISENYRRVYEASRPGTYSRCQLICDAVSGMTESYLLAKHDEFRSVESAKPKARTS